MDGQQGFLYEKSIYNILLKNELTTQKYKPSGPSVGVDTAFKIENKFYNLEIKFNLNSDFGQGTLRYDIDIKEWDIYAESIDMQNILNQFNILNFVKKEWKYIPNLNFRTTQMKQKSPKPKVLTAQEIAQDRKNFPSKNLNIQGNAIAKYYNGKNIYYIQIGNKKGFYYMGKDIANLGVPEFNPPQQKIRIRRKGSGGNKYGFKTAITIGTNVPSSSFNLDANAIFLINKNVE